MVGCVTTLVKNGFEMVNSLLQITNLVPGRF